MQEKENEIFMCLPDSKPDDMQEHRLQRAVEHNAMCLHWALCHAGSFPYSSLSAAAVTRCTKAVSKALLGKRMTTTDQCSMPWHAKGAHCKRLPAGN